MLLEMSDLFCKVIKNSTHSGVLSIYIDPIHSPPNFRGRILSMNNLERKIMTIENGKRHGNHREDWKRLKSRLLHRGEGSSKQITEWFQPSHWEVWDQRQETDKQQRN